MKSSSTDSSASIRSLRRWTGLHGVVRGVCGEPDIPAGWLGLVSVTRTPEEISVIGPWTGRGLGPYRAWSVVGPLDPGLVGILAGLLEPLRAAAIPVLAVSTHDTDWILVADDLALDAEQAWVSAGFLIADGSPRS
ncbi:MAG: hypothetical protein RLZZ461_1489 [Planctomycetota bacterium]|jgi:hypothetical protein